MSATREGLVVVVADGVGSTPDAHLAAETVATTCAAFPWTAPRDLSSWQMMVEQALVAVQATLGHAVPACRDGVEGQRPSTTLVVGLVTQHKSRFFVDWFTIGDSALIRLPRKLGGDATMEIVNGAPTSQDPTTAALPSSSPVIEVGHFEFYPEREFLVLATDGCAKPMRQDPQLYAPDFLKITESSADASHLLAAIQQSGSGFDDDATAILVSRVGTVL